ncbi:MAG TPA: hypothetical protein VFS95_00525, partial [Telluria sp.]|nr:hypothetical protein [Telluria sp.]
CSWEEPGMLNLTKGERDFIEAGGLIWCIKMNSERDWNIYKVTWEYIDALNFSVTTEEAATHWAYLLADLSLPEERVTLHNSIKRRYGDKKYPRILDEYNDVLPIKESQSESSWNFLKEFCRKLNRYKYRSLAVFGFKRHKMKGSSLPCRSNG